MLHLPLARTVDGPLADGSTRLEFAIAGVEVYRIEVDPAPREGHGRREVLAALLARFVDCEQASIRLRRDAWGKLQVLNQPSVHVNVSGSGPHLVVAIGSRPVGVDIEVIRPVVDRMALATLHLTPSERDAVLAADEDRRDELFLVAWTRKEACAKAIGAGLRIPPVGIASGVDKGLARTRISFGGATHVVDVESRLRVVGAVVSLAVLMSPKPVPDDAGDLLSYGEDGTPGGEGEAADITSWT